VQNNVTSQQASSPAQRPVRLHYLDWLRVLAILMVVLFHAVHPFDFGEWHIKNAEQSEIITIFLTLLSLWGMPFFFLVAGAASWFALQRRTAGQYVSERFKRLLVPFIVGTILFRPIVTYLEWLNKVQRGVLAVSFREFLNMIAAEYASLGFSPRWFGFGEHLWFLGFLFSFALITLPLFLWLKREPGRRIVSRMGGLCEHRGGLLLFILPLLVVQLSVRPFFPTEHDWADFFFQMSFFALGYFLFADERFTRAIRRDWWLLLALGTAIVLGLLGMYVMGFPVITWGETPAMPQFYLVQTLVTAVAFSYTLTMLFVGMRFLNFTNRWLQYAQEAVLPLFVVHQPVIIVVAFFVVQWAVGIPVKLLTVVLGSFAVSLALYELIIRRVRLLRALFGMRAGK
jgi:glucan biosynthesis protein C